MKALLLLVALVFTIAEVTSALDIRADGCTTLGFERRYAKIFEPACNKHDDCYDACRPRKECDDKFLADMRKICDGEGIANKAECRRKANLFYVAVRTFGWGFYFCPWFTTMLPNFGSTTFPGPPGTTAV